MQVLQNFRRVVEHLKEEVKRHQTRQAAHPEGGVRDAYHFDVREDDVSVAQEPVKLHAIEITEAAPSYRELHASYRRAALVERLGTKDALRDAILVNEILQKPVALRRRR